MLISMDPETKRKVISGIIKDLASDGLDRVRSMREAFSYWPEVTPDRCIYLKGLISQILVLLDNIEDVVMVGDGKDRSEYSQWNDIVPGSHELEQDRLSQNLLKAEQEFRSLVGDCQNNPQPDFALIRGRLFTLTQALKNAFWSATLLSVYVPASQKTLDELEEASSTSANDLKYRSGK